MLVECAYSSLAFVRRKTPVSFATMAVAAAVIWTPFGASLVTSEWLPYAKGAFLVAAISSLAQIFRFHVRAAAA